MPEWQRSELLKRVRDAAPKAGFDPPGDTADARGEALSAMAATYHRLWEQDAAITAKWAQRWRELSALDQLFIAV